jgi:hypothetical protein
MRFYPKVPEKQTKFERKRVVNLVPVGPSCGSVPRGSGGLFFRLDALQDLTPQVIQSGLT